MSKKEETLQAEAPQKQRVQVAAVPLPLLGQITDKLRELPHKEADPLLQQLNTCRIAELEQ